MLEVSGLSVKYGAHPALNDVGLSVDFGEIVVILGANGAGKSSLLNAIAGTSEGHVAGTVRLDGSPLSGEAADTIVERGIAFVPEGRGIFGDLTVGENLTLGAYSAHARNSQTANLNKVYELFPKLRERNSQVARTMSGGEQQMVAIGRAMMSDPKILMLDEPSLGLSPLLCKELFANLTKVRETGIGVLMVEQNAKQSLAIADRGYLIENGSITGQNDAQAMLNDPAVQAAYLGGAAAKQTTTGAGFAATTAVPAASAAQSGSKTFISVGGHSNNDLAPVAGDDIASMVARASQTSLDQPPPPAPSQSSSPARMSGTSHTAPDGPKNKPKIIDVAANLPPQDTNVAAASSDPKLQEMLKSMENAAKGARLGSNGAPTPAPVSRPAPKIEPEEDLPTIPVFKKSTVEVYRRASDGSMQRVKR